jgi:hypothetical protein
MHESRVKKGSRACFVYRLRNDGSAIAGGASLAHACCPPPAEPQATAPLYTIHNALSHVDIEPWQTRQHQLLCREDLRALAGLDPPRSKLQVPACLDRQARPVPSATLRPADRGVVPPFSYRLRHLGARQMYLQPQAVARLVTMHRLLQLRRRRVRLLRPPDPSNPFTDRPRARMPSYIAMCR